MKAARSLPDRTFGLVHAIPALERLGTTGTGPTSEGRRRRLLLPQPPARWRQRPRNLFLYAGLGRFFTDEASPDYDSSAARQTWKQILSFLDALSGDLEADPARSLEVHDAQDQL